MAELNLGQLGKEHPWDIPNYDSDGVDMEPCPDPDCKWADARGICVFETCFIKEIPVLHKKDILECIICKKLYPKVPQHNKLYMCPKCLRHLQDVLLNDDDFVCGFCGAVQAGGNRKIPDADICDKCYKALKHEISSPDKC